MRAHRRLPEGPDQRILEFALVRRHSAALKTTLLRHYFHPEYRLTVWFANTCAKPRAPIPEGPDQRILEFALVPRHSAALKTTLLRHYFRPEYRLTVWFANTCAKTRASMATSGLTGRCLAFAPFTPKTSDASFCSVRHKRTR